MTEVKTYEYRKLFRFSYNKLFDVSSQGIFFDNTLYGWDKVVSIKQKSIRSIHIGLIEFRGGTKCSFNLSTFRQKGQKVDYFFGVNSDFNHLKSILYKQKIVIPERKKSEERDRRLRMFMDAISIEPDPIKRKELMDNLDSLVSRDINDFRSTLDKIKAHTQNT